MIVNVDFFTMPRWQQRAGLTWLGRLHRRRPACQRQTCRWWESWGARADSCGRRSWSNRPWSYSLDCCHGTTSACSLQSRPVNQDETSGCELHRQRRRDWSPSPTHIGHSLHTIKAFWFSFSVYLSVTLFVYLSQSVTLTLSVCLKFSVCLSHSSCPDNVKGSLCSPLWRTYSRAVDREGAWHQRDWQRHEPAHPTKSINNSMNQSAQRSVQNQSMREQLIQINHQFWKAKPKCCRTNHSKHTTRKHFQFIIRSATYSSETEFFWGS